MCALLSRSLGCGLVLAAASVVPVLSYGSVVISDSTFQNADWTHVEIADTGSNGTLTVNQQSAGGNPGSYQQGIHNWGPGFVSYTHLYAPMGYDPSTQGAISSIDFTYDFITEAVTNPVTGGVSTSFFVTQGANRWFVNSLTVLAGSSWQTSALSGIAASDLSGIDFSASGSLIAFGYQTSNSTTQVDGRTSTWGIDNWAVTVNQIGEPNPIPEPSSLLLVVAALVGLSIRARMTREHA